MNNDPWVRLMTMLEHSKHDTFHATVVRYKPGDGKRTFWFGRTGQWTPAAALWPVTIPSLVRLSDDASDYDVAKKALDRAWAWAAGLNAPRGVEWADTKTHIQMCILGLAE